MTSKMSHEEWYVALKKAADFINYLYSDEISITASDANTEILYRQAMHSLSTMYDTIGEPLENMTSNIIQFPQQKKSNNLELVDVSNDASSTASINKGKETANTVNTTTTTTATTMKNTTKTATYKFANYKIQQDAKAAAGLSAIMAFSQWEDKEALNAAFPFLSEMNEEVVLNNTKVFPEHNQEFEDFKNAVFGDRYTKYNAYLDKMYGGNFNRGIAQERKTITKKIRKAAKAKLESVKPNSNTTASAKEAPASNVVSPTASINKGKETANTVNTVNTTTTTETNTMKNTTKTAANKLANFKVQGAKAIAGLSAIITFSQWEDNKAIDAVFPFLSEMNEEVVLNNTVVFRENNQEFRDFKNAVFGERYTKYNAYLREMYSANHSEKITKEGEKIAKNIRKAANIKLSSVKSNSNTTTKEAGASNVASIPATQNKGEETTSTNTNTNTNTNTDEKTMYTVNNIVLQTTENYANRIVTILNFSDFTNEEALDKTFPFVTSYDSELIHSGESYEDITSDRVYRREVFGEKLTTAGETVKKLYESALQASPEPATLHEEATAVLNQMHKAAISKISMVRKAAESNTQTEVSSTTSINKCEESAPVATEAVEEIPTVQETPAPVSSVKTETKVKTKPNTKKGQKPMKSIQQYVQDQAQAQAEPQAQAETNSPVNTNNTAKTTMSTKVSTSSALFGLVKATLTVNVTLSNTNMLSEGTIQMMAGKSKNGSYITTTRGGSMHADYRDGHDRVWAEVFPLPDATYDAYGNYNCAVWELEYKNGTRQILNHEQSILFWNIVLNNENGHSVEDYSMKVKVNFPSDITATQTKEMLSHTEFRSYSITFNNVDDMFEPRRDVHLYDTKDQAGTILIPLNADVYFERNTKELPRLTLGAGHVHSGMFADSTTPKFRLADLPGKTKSEIRRGTRKEDHKVTAEVAAPSSTAPSSVQEVIPAVSAEAAPVIPATPAVPVQVEAARAALPAEVEVKVEVKEEAPSEPTVNVEEVDAKPKATNSKEAMMAIIAVTKAKQATEDEAATQEVVTEEAPVVKVAKTTAERMAELTAKQEANKAKKKAAGLNFNTAPASAPEFVVPDAEDMAEFSSEFGTNW